MKTNEGQSRTQRKTKATRDSIVNAAAALLASGGDAAVTMDAVSEYADVSVQTIYNRVGGRPALLIAACEQALLELDAYMTAAFSSEGTVVQRLHAVIDSYARFASESPVQFRVLAEPPDEPGSLLLLTRKGDAEGNAVVALLREGIEDGSFDSAVDPVLTARVLWASMNGVLSLAWRPDVVPQQPEDQAVLVQEAKRLFLRCVIAQPSPGEVRRPEQIRLDTLG